MPPSTTRCHGLPFHITTRPPDPDHIEQKRAKTHQPDWQSRQPKVTLPCWPQRCGGALPSKGPSGAAISPRSKRLQIAISNLVLGAVAKKSNASRNTSRTPANALGKRRRESCITTAWRWMMHRLGKFFSSPRSSSGASAILSMA